MHELSVAAEIVDTAVAAASGTLSGVITSVHITMDPASHLDRSVLSEAFRMAATGTRASTATLVVLPDRPGIRGVAVTAIDIDTSAAEMPPEATGRGLGAGA